MQSSEAVLAVSSRSWLSYYYQSRFHLTPLSYDVLEFASSFCSEQCPEGIVAIASNTLRSDSFPLLLLSPHSSHPSFLFLLSLCGSKISHP